MIRSENFILQLLSITTLCILGRIIIHELNNPVLNQPIEHRVSHSAKSMPVRGWALRSAMNRDGTEPALIH
jgi:hypothetical protein